MFNSFNKVVVMGHMTRDAEIRTTPSGAQVAEIALAVNERVKQGDEWADEVVFVDVTAWAKTAELLQRFGGKGKCVLVEGKLKQDKWVDKQSGQNRTKLKVVAHSVVFVRRPKGESDGGEQTSSGYAESPDSFGGF